MMLSYLNKVSKKIYAFPDLLLDKIKPAKPHHFLKNQSESFAKYLPYVTFLDLERPTCLLNDGSLGVAWELSPLSHEAMSYEDLKTKLENISLIFNKERSEISFQLIFDSEPQLHVPFEEAYTVSKTSPEFFIQKRIEEVKKFAFKPNHYLRLMQRKVYLTLHYAKKSSIAQKSILEKHATESVQETEELMLISQDLNRVCDEVEYVLKHSSIAFKQVHAQGFLHNLRSVFHSISDRQNNETLKSIFDADKTLSSQVLKGFLEVIPNAIGVGEDTWEVLSWIDQPPSVYFGLFATLLTIDMPLRMVLNIRKCADVSDLDRKQFLLKNASDSFGEMQREQIKGTQDRIARGENLLFISLHLFVRNCNLNILQAKENGIGKQLVSKMKTLTQIDFLLEKYNAPAIFMMSLPFCFSSSCAGFSGREKRVLSGNVAPYLPIFGGFQGTKSNLQLMISRAGDAIWLNPFDSETSPHIAVLASSGGGKSFFAQNLMMSFFAKESSKKPLLFIIDKKTSYEIFAKVVGEEFGSQIVKPPEYFPNIFRGKIDEYRLPVIVGILKTAMSLVTKDAELGSIEEILLTQAVKETFEQHALDASTDFKDGKLRAKDTGKMQVPRLSDVVDNLFPVCAKLQLNEQIAKKISQYLSPFLDNGPYNNLFNKLEYDELDPQTPGVSLFDIDFVSSHPILSTLTTQMILSEILRQIRRPENIGKTGMLVIEEVGVLAQGSPELTQFIQDAWKTFRKLGFCCMGLTNEVDDYVKKAGAREIWNVSPNKILLKMTGKDLQKALHGEVNYPPLFEDKLVGNLLSSLKKEDGKYSQGFWWSEETKGSFIYIPTCYDYWCAASKPIEVNVVYEVAKCFSGHKKPFFEAVNWLAEWFPFGIRDENGTLRKLTEEEKNKAKQIGAQVVPQLKSEGYV